MLEKQEAEMETNELTIEGGRRFLRANWDRCDFSRTDQSGGAPVPPQEKPVPEGGRLIDLVASDRLTSGRMPLLDAIRNRQSRRTFGPSALTLEELSYLVYCTQGIRRYGDHGSRRTVPSGGSRHSFETYLYLARVESLEAGLYRYLPVPHRLALLDTATDLAARLNEGLHGQYWNAAAVFIWTTIPYRMEWRYSVVSHKIIALDAGHVCQNLYLACESIGCGTCAIGAYDQERMDRFLQVDGSDEFVVYAAPVGRV
jgi:SagB-type dehydrogenase family enzyme